MKVCGFEIKPYTHRQLAAIYCCSEKTLRTWLVRFQEELGPRDGYSYNHRQVRIIVEKLGEP